MHEPFLKAILERPNDDVPRLVYADWLDELGDSRAEFIRVQCELAQLKADDPHGDDLRLRERELLAKSTDDWLGRLWSIIDDYQFHRGFVESICISCGNFERWQHKLLDWAPLRRVELNLCDSSLDRSFVEGIFRTIAESQDQQMKIVIPDRIIEFVPESVARENIVLPLQSVGKRLTIAHAEPHGSDLFAKIDFILNRNCEYIEVSRDCLVGAILNMYGDSQFEYVDCVSYDIIPEDFSTSSLAGEIQYTDSPIARLVGLILAEALSLHATAVHIEPLPDRIRTCYQVKGEMVERDGHPRRIHPFVIAQLKRLAGIEPTDEQMSQVGSFVLQQNRRYEARVAFRQKLAGEAVVIHIEHK